MVAPKSADKVTYGWASVQTIKELEWGVVPLTICHLSSLDKMIITRICQHKDLTEVPWSALDISDL